MRKLQDNWPQLARALEGALRSSGISDSELARASGVNYFAVRRMRTQGVSNRSKNAKELCKFFGLSGGGQSDNRAAELSMLADRVREAWDGTPGHRQFLEDMLAWASRYKVVPR